MICRILFTLAAVSLLAAPISSIEYRIEGDDSLLEFARHRRQADNESENVNVTSSTNKPTTVSTTRTTLSPPTSPSTKKPETPITTKSPLVDSHTFYVVQPFDDFDRFWVELYFGKLPSNIANNLSSVAAYSHDKLSVSYRTAAVVDLKFTFPFYGHPIKRVVIATGGFIYVGEMLNPRLLTFSQFIAPLMANFDFSVSTSDRLLYFHNESMLIVEWRDVVLQENPSLPFRFQAQIHRDGRIVFAYRDIPIDLSSISEVKHPVETGLSDAYSSEQKDSSGTSQQTLNKYAEIEVPPSMVKSRSVVVIRPLPTCIQITSCSTCLTPSPDLAFRCAWCPTLKRCSYGFDRGRKAWMDNSCDSINVTSKSACSLLPVNQREGVSLFSQPLSPSANTAASGGSSPSVGAWVVLVILIVLAVLAAVGFCVGWVVYAHRNPSSRAGIWMIEHRPARLLADGGDFFRRSLASARNFFSSSKPSPSDNGATQRQQPVVMFNGSNNNGNHNPYDVSVGGVTVSASRI